MLSSSGFWRRVYAQGREQHGFALRRRHLKVRSCVKLDVRGTPQARERGQGEGTSFQGAISRSDAFGFNTDVQAFANVLGNYDTEVSGIQEGQKQHLSIDDAGMEPVGARSTATGVPQNA